MKKRSPAEAMNAVSEAENLVVEQGDTIREDARWEAAEAAMDGRSKQYLAEIISGKREGPYESTSHFRPGRRGRGPRER